MAEFRVQSLALDFKFLRKLSLPPQMKTALEDDLQKLADPGIDGCDRPVSEVLADIGRTGGLELTTTRVNGTTDVLPPASTTTQAVTPRKKPPSCLGVQSATLSVPTPQLDARRPTGSASTAGDHGLSAAAAAPQHACASSGGEKRKSRESVDEGSDPEERKRQITLGRNRATAAKCRAKRRDLIASLTQQVQELAEVARGLQAENQVLRVAHNLAQTEADNLRAVVTTLSAALGS